jgi:lysophospholipase L1-like esterase
VHFRIRPIVRALALGVASLGGGCSGIDSPVGTEAAAGTLTAGVSGSMGEAGAALAGMGGQAVAGGGGQVVAGGAGQVIGGGGAAGTPGPTAGMATGGDSSQGGQATAGSAGLSGTGGMGGGGTSAYNPCPTDGTPCKILPFGDSITRGVKSSDDAGYRSALFKLVVAAKQNVIFTGSLSNGPTQVSGQSFPRMHEGRPGWTIDPGYNMISSSYGGISSLVPSPALDGKPHIILLMIGTNDLFARDTANMAARLEVLLDKIASNAPNALIVLAQITPLDSTNAALSAYNVKIPGIVQSHAEKGQHIIGVDMSKLPTSELKDGTHPNDQGYAYMANVWYTAIKGLLPNKQS